jgi:transposase-like protein
LLPVIEEYLRPDSIVYTDTFRSYNALDISAFHHLRINHSELFADQTMCRPERFREVNFSSFFAIGPDSCRNGSFVAQRNKEDE